MVPKVKKKKFIVEAFTSTEQVNHPMVTATDKVLDMV